MALIEKLNAIGDAIRAKTGGSEKLTLDQMPAEIEGIETGGGGSIEVEPIVLTGSCDYGCKGDLGSAVIKYFGDAISTEKITSAQNIFEGNTTEYIPFDINCGTNTTGTYNYVFKDCKQLKALPKMNNVTPSNIVGLFYHCYNLREIPDDYFDNWNLSYLSNATSGYMGNASYMFDSCYSLRSMPLGWLKNMNPRNPHNYSYYNGAFNCCYALDELVNMPVPYINTTWTSNGFLVPFGMCSRLKRLTFETNEDGSPKVVQWGTQTIDLSSFMGYGTTSITDIILNYNSGITADKIVKDDATYQALKNDPDWFSQAIEYSRYNHDSAVETINSLPDTSAYLATTGRTNTIKFKGASGSLTDGGAINTLTEEEIAVATAKGWTVSFT